MIEAELQVSQYSADNRPSHPHTSSSNTYPSLSIDQNSTILWFSESFSESLDIYYMYKYLYSSGMFIRISRTDDTKYIP